MNGQDIKAILGRNIKALRSQKGLTQCIFRPHLNTNYGTLEQDY
jgi:DNA-binding transcriptional regulator YiaG